MTKDEVMSYKVVEHANIEIFVNIVNGFILDGWSPLGGVCSMSRIDHTGLLRDHYMQAMTRPPKVKPIVVFAGGNEVQ